MTVDPTSQLNPSAPRVSDAPANNVVDHWAPGFLKPYLRLGRFDRPIGSWLLLFPCWWSATLVAIATNESAPNWWHFVLFAIGAFVMRGAGCAYNDYVDRDFDAKVERTKSRPIPSGQVTPTQALGFVVALSLTGLLVLLQLNFFTIGLAISSLALVALYPFMKRLTDWPQLVLGLTFNWGALVGWAATAGEISLAPLLLYAGAVFWTLGYDTIYAHQDKEDDLTLGLKSTALHLGTQSLPWITGFYLAAVGLWALAALTSGAGLLSFIALALTALHFGWQIATLEIDNPDNCLRRFRSNRDAGTILLVGLLSDALLKSMI